MAKNNNYRPANIFLVLNSCLFLSVIVNNPVYNEQIELNKQNGVVRVFGKPTCDLLYNWSRVSNRPERDSSR